MTENELKNLLAAVTPPDEAARAAAHAYWAALAKPLGGLGRLEAMVEDAAALTGDPVPDVSRRAVLVLCADNGVVAQGVSQTDAYVTRAVLENLTARRTSVCRMAAAAHCDVVPVDMGIAGAPVPGAADCRIAAGTADFTTGPAMTRAQAVQAIAAGIALVRAQKQNGAQLLATGEMGIGNTTTSSAVASVLLGRPVAEMTGRGAGLSDAGLHRKIDAIERGIARNHPDAADPLGVLAALGGFDIAGLCGVFLGGAALPRGGKGRFRQPCVQRASRTYCAGRAVQKTAYHRGAASGRGHGRGGQPAAVGYGAGRLQRLLLVCGGRHHAVHPAVLTLVIGGAASGKSAYAESLCLRAPLPRTYLATMQVWDAECAARVAKHRAMRAEKQFTTVECPLHLDRVALPRRGTVLLEDLGNLAANELYDPDGAGTETAAAILRGIDKMLLQCDNLIVVSNEVFSGGADYADDTDRYLRALAAVNNAAAARADRVVRVVCGIPVYYKGSEGL